MLDRNTEIKKEVVNLYYDILCKQIEPFPHNSLFHKVSEEDIHNYWFTIMTDIERLCKLTLAKDIKLRYDNNVFKMPERGEFIKSFFNGETK